MLQAWLSAHDLLLSPGIKGLNKYSLTHVFSMLLFYTL